MYELVTQIGKTFHTHRNHLIPHYPKELLLFPHIERYIEQNRVLFHDSDAPDMIQNSIFTSFDNISESNAKVSGDDSFCNDYGDTIIKFHIELYKSVKLNVDNHHPFRSKSDSGSFYHTPRSSKFQSFINFPEIFANLDNNTG